MNTSNLDYELGEEGTEPRIDRLTALADHLEFGKLGHEVFDFSYWNYCVNGNSNTCGTHGCAVGELPILFPNSWQFGDDGYNIASGKVFLIHTEYAHRLSGLHAAGEFFHISSDEAYMLFQPDTDIVWLTEDIDEELGYYGRLPSSATKEMVSKNIRLYIKWVESGERASWYEAVGGTDED